MDPPIQEIQVISDDEVNENPNPPIQVISDDEVNENLNPPIDAVAVDENQNHPPIDAVAVDENQNHPPIDAVAVDENQNPRIDAVAVEENPNPQINAVMISLMVKEIQAKRRKGKKAKEEEEKINEEKAKEQERARRKRKTEDAWEEEAKKLIALISSDLPSPFLSPYMTLLSLRTSSRRTAGMISESLPPLEPSISYKPQIAYPYPWNELGIQEIAKIGLGSIEGEIHCTGCGTHSVASLDWREGFALSSGLMFANLMTLGGEEMFLRWKPPLDVYFRCQLCWKRKAVPWLEPTKEVNWLFIFFTHMIGHVPMPSVERYLRSKQYVVSLSELPTKKELIFNFYITMLHILDPGGGWARFLNYDENKLINEAYHNDRSPMKLNLNVHAYQPEVGKLVKKVEQHLKKDLTNGKENIPITGLSDFNNLSAELIFGADSPAIQENRIVTVQCFSGTESLRIGAEFLTRRYGQVKMHIPLPTSGDHIKLFGRKDISVKYYRYDPSTSGLDSQGLLEDLNSASEGEVVLLHACAHNPTGVDPTLAQWEQIRQLVRSKGLLPFFDCAYQGFASGSLDTDAQAVRMFVADGGDCLAAQCYAKSMGLYEERIGALSMVCQAAHMAREVENLLKLVIRPMYSSPPINVASIVATILKDRDMYDEWTNELREKADRITSMRQQLFDALRTKETPGVWGHILEQRGMFTVTGLNTEEVAFISNRFHIYMSSDGRINMVGLNPDTVLLLADAIHRAVTRFM